MYTLNITTLVENTIVRDWLLWQTEEYIPALMKTDCFITYRFHQLLEQDESEGKTFVLQLVSETMEKYLEFINYHEKSLQNISIIKWGNDYVEFRTLLQNIG